MNIRMITLESVGMVYDLVNKNTYPLFKDGSIDFENPTHITEVEYDGFENINVEDTETLDSIGVSVVFDMKIELI
jgi:hypothetical protein